MGANDPLLDVYIYENNQLLEQLELILLEGEKNKVLNEGNIDEIFRIMHTIKGSSAMMSFDSLAHVAHSIEDLFSQIRERPPRGNDWENIFDIVLTGADFIKTEIAKITAGMPSDGEAEALVEQIHDYLNVMSKRKASASNDSSEHDANDDGDDYLDLPGNFYCATLYFENECKMENIRAFGVVNELTPKVQRIASIPEDLLAEDSSDYIVSNGCKIYLKSDENPDELSDIIAATMFVNRYTFNKLDPKSTEIPESIRDKEKTPLRGLVSSATTAVIPDTKQNFISVNVTKLDKLMDLVGEIVTTESMVTKNPDLVNLHLDSFQKSAQELRKLTDELQNTVMSIRMVPISTTFHKMQRLVRDMSKKVDKEVDLVIVGEETEIDKSINDNLSDPLMHMIRNSMDHGIETPEERARVGKPVRGTITLEARNTGGDVMIIISDDGKGLNRQTLIEKAARQGILNKPENEISDREAFNLIFAPGFSTKESVTEFSGRGVGMDVVRKNIDAIGGTLNIESTLGKGMSTIIRIPLTLAIVAGMRIQVGDSMFILPVLSIRTSFNPKPGEAFVDPDNNEMIMIRGEVFRILRLHEVFGIETPVTKLEDGILIVVESDEGAICLFADRLIGEQQAVVKPIPPYIARNTGRLYGMSGCTVLGDGSINLILDINSLAAG